MSQYYGGFQDARFRENVQKALDEIQKIMDTTRHPRMVDINVDHTYNDKFLLAETLTNVSLTTIQTVFKYFGFTEEHWKQCVTWVAEHKVVTLRFDYSKSETFLKETEEEVCSPVSIENVTTVSNDSEDAGENTSRKVEKIRIKQKIKKSHGQTEVAYSLQVFAGNDPDSSLTLAEGKLSTVIIESGNSTNNRWIAPETQQHDLNLTWYFQQWLECPPHSNFSIDRDQAKTPRRNFQVDESNKFHYLLGLWAVEVYDSMDWIYLHFLFNSYQNPEDFMLFLGVLPENLDDITTNAVAKLVGDPDWNLEGVKWVRRNEPKPGILDDAELSAVTKLVGVSLSEMPSKKEKKAALESFLDWIRSAESKLERAFSLREDPLIIPVQPLMEGGTILKDMNALLNAHENAIDAELAAISDHSRSKPSLVSLSVLSNHLADVTRHYQDCIHFLEQLLMDQVVKAVGKRITPKDFEVFMHFHGPRLLRPVYTPRPFSYAIRQTGHAPEGVISINSRETETPVDTIVRFIDSSQHVEPLRIRIDASSMVSLKCDWYLHGWMMHRFTDECSSSPYFLSARARQFSCFLLVIGNLSGPHELDPKHAIVLQNKDDLMISLLTDVLPSAKDFKDATASLSPEQRDFCKAFRSMQLGTSVFGLAVIQLKPQMERLLGLLPGSLTKEIQLTQDLTSLFTEYQINRDLLAFDGPSDFSKADRLTAVRNHVKTILQVISEEKEKAILEERGKLPSAKFSPEEARAKHMANELDWLRSNDPEALDFLDELSVGSFHTIGGTRLGDSVSDLVASAPAAKRSKELRAVDQPSIVSVPSAKLSPEEARAKDMANALDWLRRNDPEALDFLDASSVGSFHTIGGTRLGDSVAGEHDLPAFEFSPGSKGAGPKGSFCSMRDTKLRGSVGEPVVPTFDFEGVASVPTAKTSPEESRENDMQSALGNLNENFTLLPKEIDTLLETLDTDNALHATSVKADNNWDLLRQANILSPLKKVRLGVEQIDREKKKAFDLLDAISCSGALPIETAEVHVIVGLSHCFEKDLMGTIVEDNVNPIAKAEKSLLMLASTICRARASEMIAQGQDRTRLAALFPMLFDEAIGH